MKFKFLVIISFQVQYITLSQYHWGHVVPFLRNKMGEKRSSKKELENVQKQDKKIAYIMEGTCHKTNHFLSFFLEN